MALFGDALGNFLVTIVSIYFLIRGSFASRLLAGLTCYKVQSQAAAAAAAAEPSLPGIRSAKQERKIARIAKKQEIQIGGAERVSRIELPRSVIEATDFFPDLELVVNAAVVLAGNYALAASPLPALGYANLRWPIYMAAALPLGVIWLLAKVELFTLGTSTQDKAIVCGLCVVLTGLAGAVLQLSPAWLLDFDFDAASKQLGDLVTQATSSVHVVPQETLDLVISPAVLKGLTAAVSGILVGLASNAAVRASRCFEAAAAPPRPIKQYLGFSWPVLALLQLNVALPLAVGILWVKPLSQDLLGWPDDRMHALRAAVVLVLGILQSGVARPLVQAYMNLGLVHWWTQKHAITTTDGKSAKIGEYIRMKVDFINMILCKVAVQLLAPALVLLATGSLLAYTAFQEAGSTGILGSLKPGIGLRVPAQLIQSTAGFLAWWTSVCWFTYTAVILTMYRFGNLVT